MKKLCTKLVAVFLIIAMSLSFCSCSIAENVANNISSLINPKGIIEDVSLGYTEIDKTSFNFCDYYPQIECRESYDLLENDNMRKLYDELYDSAYFVYPAAYVENEYKCKQVILEDAALTQAQIRLTIKALTDDNPHIFWLSTTFGYLTSVEENYTAVQLYSRLEPQELQTSVARLKVMTDEFYSSLEKGLTPYQLELYIHDYIIDKCKYDTTVMSSDNIPSDKASAFDPYGVMVKGVAVCEGYARTFQMLCNGVGIRCVIVIGESEGELHMWNAVELDSDFYYVDTTWDDKDDNAFRYDYFNITTEQLSVDHEFSPLSTEMSDEQICGDDTLNALTSNFMIPDCDSTDYNYYVKSCAALTDYSGDSVIDSLLNSASKKEDVFHFYIDPDALTFEYAIDQLFYTYPQYFFGYIDTVNYSLPDYSIDTYNLNLYQKDWLNTVTVILKYV